MEKLITLIPKTDIRIGMKVYFETENYQGNGIIHYIPNEEEQQFQNLVNGENAISIKARNQRPVFVPISQIIILE